MATKAELVVSSAKARLGDPYVFAARGESCTPQNRKSRARDDYPEIISKCQVLNGSKAECSGCKYEGRHIYDCRGFTYRCLLDVGIKIEGAGATSQYNTASNWAERGTTDQMPDKVCCVFKYREGKMQHTGLHIGGGKIIHCSGEVETVTINKNWTHYAIPKGLYSGETAVEGGSTIIVASTLKKGSKGDAVKKLQSDLTQAGFSCGAIDGIFGSKTLAAVKAFQQAAGLTVDGLVGSQTQTALANWLAAGGGTTGTEQPTPTTPATVEERVTALETAVAEIKKKIGL